MARRRENDFMWYEPATLQEVHGGIRAVSQRGSFATTWWGKRVDPHSGILGYPSPALPGKELRPKGTGDGACGLSGRGGRQGTGIQGWKVLHSSGVRRPFRGAEGKTSSDSGGATFSRGPATGKGPPPGDGRDFSPGRALSFPPPRGRSRNELLLPGLV